MTVNSRLTLVAWFIAYTLVGRGYSQKANGKWGLIDELGAFVMQPEWNLIERYQEVRDTPAHRQAARQRDEEVRIEWLEISGKRVWGSESFRLVAAETAGSNREFDSEPPILQYRELIRKAPSPDQPNVPAFNIGKPLLVIRSVRSVAFSRDGKTVTLVLNDDDRKKFAELTQHYQGDILFCQVSENPLIGGVGLFSAPTEDGVIEFSEARKSGQIAEYLRHRFWNELPQSADLKPTDSDKPVFRFLAQHVSIDISSVRQLIVRPDGKGITVVLNDEGRKKVAELLKKISPAEINCEVVGLETEKDKQFSQQVGEPVHEVWKLSAISNGEDGILQFGESNGGVEAANYLRHRFGK
ncbi:MAG: hypothetical protein ACREFF_06045 [Candidatus Udaeobacter sp.]